MSFQAFRPDHSDEDRFAVRKALAATGLLIAFGAMFAWAPKDDPFKVVAGLPCSVLTEHDIGAVIGTPVRLMPTSGSICQYEPSETQNGPAVFVVAHTDTSIPGHTQKGTTAVRVGSRVYTVAVVSRDPAQPSRDAEAQRLAKLLGRPIIAENR